MSQNFENLEKISECIHSNLKDNLFEKIYRELQENNYKFVDGDFNYQNWSSLAGSPPANDVEHSWNRIQWKRPDNIWGINNYEIFNDVNPDDIIQGGLGDCYFLCCLSALAEYPKWITRLFEVEKVNKYSIYAVWLNITGQWKKIILDDYIPCNKNNPVFSSTKENELWVILLEKAYAKAYGGYHQISGGDPVYALRDLTGCPFERIEDFKDLNSVWNKLVKYNKKGYMMTCYTQNTDIVEEQDEMGMVSGHAYTLIDVQDVYDCYNRKARIMQIRNPWGSFEWKGDWSDNSPLWTEDYKKKLKVVNKDDGLFWMEINDFSKNFTGIGVGKIEPENKFNSIYFQKDYNKIMVRFIIDYGNDVTISIDQKDSRLFPESEGYTYSYFRVTIGRVINEEIEFVDCKLSPERNIFFEDIEKPGIYIALIEPYWCKNSHSFGISTYSPNQCNLELLDCNNELFNKLEYIIWRNYGIKYKSQFKNPTVNNLRFENKKAGMKKTKLLNYNFGLNLINYENQSSNCSIKIDIEIKNLTGFDSLGRHGISKSQQLFINKNKNDILILKMDPRKSDFGCSQKINKYELLNQNLENDKFPLFALENYSGLSPTINNPNPRLNNVKNLDFNKYSKVDEQEIDDNNLFCNYNGKKPKPKAPPKISDNSNNYLEEDENNCIIF